MSLAGVLLFGPRALAVSVTFSQQGAVDLRSDQTWTMDDLELVATIEDVGNARTVTITEASLTLNLNLLGASAAVAHAGTGSLVLTFARNGDGDWAQDPGTGDGELLVSGALGLFRLRLDHSTIEDQTGSFLWTVPADTFGDGDESLATTFYLDELPPDDTSPTGDDGDGAQTGGRPLRVFTNESPVVLHASVAAVPEPGTVALLTVATASIALRRGRRRRG